MLDNPIFKSACAIMKPNAIKCIAILFLVGCATQSETLLQYQNVALAPNAEKVEIIIKGDTPKGKTLLGDVDNGPIGYLNMTACKNDLRNKTLALSGNLAIIDVIGYDGAYYKCSGRAFK